jgi:hypothetical protein
MSIQDLFTTDEQRALPNHLCSTLENSVTAVDTVMKNCFSVTLQVVGASTNCLLTGQDNHHFFDTPVHFKTFLDTQTPDAKSRCLEFLAPYHAFGNPGFLMYNPTRTRTLWKHKFFGFWLTYLQNRHMTNHSHAVELFKGVQKKLFANLQANLWTLHDAVRGGRGEPVRGGRDEPVRGGRDEEDGKSTSPRRSPRLRTGSASRTPSERGEADGERTGLRRSSRPRTPTLPRSTTGDKQNGKTTGSRRSRIRRTPSERGKENGKV